MPTHLKVLAGMHPGKGQVYFVQTDGDVKSSSVKTEAPKAFSYENTSTLELAGRQNNTEDGTLMFYAYGGGKIFRKL